MIDCLDFGAHKHKSCPKLMQHPIALVLYRQNGRWTRCSISYPIPWQASIQSSSGWHFCGGTILDAKTVLCARQCPVSLDSKVVVGFTKLFGDEAGTQTSNVASVVINSAQPYNETTLENDVIILKLETPLTLGDTVQAACLPNPDFKLDIFGYYCWVSGWGWGYPGSTLQWKYH